MRSLLLLLITLCFCARGQDTTKILFVGNSFTYYNNMPEIVKTFADSATIPMIYAMHAPPGISVGDTVQGNQAHMNNPSLYALIRNKKWDVVVIQDNQGRFVRDSAQFPASSKVVEGHLKIMDSVKANNDCAKIVLFSGWAFKYGSPPYGNTGVEMIQRISRNYVVLNDSMKEVIAPIGEAWIKSAKYLPSVNLWDIDDAHPSYAGSYLTASVLFSTIFDYPAILLNYTGFLPPASADKLRAFADTAVFDPGFHVKYNLGGIRRVMPAFVNGQLSIPGAVTSYQWFKDQVLIGSASAITPTADGNYKAIVEEADGCILKTCTYSYSVPTAPSTGVADATHTHHFSVFPNPVSTGHFDLRFDDTISPTNIELLNVNGIKEPLLFETGDGLLRISTQGLRPGCYVLLLSSGKELLRTRVIILD